MCGILFIAQREPARIGQREAAAALAQQRWRGPDAERLVTLDGGRVHLGHNRLAIIDPGQRADQPMRSRDGRYTIVFNGEIYNHRDLARAFALDELRTASDTEVLLEGYARHGEDFVERLEGMYAFVIHDAMARSWIAARDALGIKPLYWHEAADRTVVIASEPAVVASLAGAPVDAQSLAEWRLVRRPVPGASFFVGVHELPPGTLRRSDGSTRTLWRLARHNDRFDQVRFEALLHQVVREHELSDVDNVALLSGGIDSAAIVALSQLRRAYSVGLDTGNEFAGAAETARALGRTLETVAVTEAQLHARWARLARLRGEPLALPNEALIHAACAAMRPGEKVVLTGEGADELLFGYDRLFRWAAANERFDRAAFLSMYGYSARTAPTRRLADWIGAIVEGACGRPIDVVEDFFYKLHLPGLLRRMDFASMAASKEARVPFADRRLVDHCYRLPAAAKLDASEAKKPLRELLARLGLKGPLARPKIGFAARADAANTMSRDDEYAAFRALNLEALGWS
jgi:asparagine synthase (glutamine-hydrolysing)